MNNSARQMSFHVTVPRREIDVARAIRLLTVALLFILMVVVAIAFPSDPTPGLFGSDAAPATTAHAVPSASRPA